MKHSVIYGIAFTQPFTSLADVTPLMQHAQLEKMDEISYGAFNPSVKHIQYKLKKLGYYEDKMDGAFGLRTEHAVKKLQSSHHLKVTGNMNRETVEAISWEEIETDIKTIESLMDSMTYGDHNDDVALVQEVLLYYGYYHGSVDSVYGSLTEQAIHSVKQDILTEQDKNDTRDHSLPEDVSSQVEVANEKTQKEKEESTEPKITQLEVNSADTTILTDAKAHLGTPYVWGGTNPEGFDCSGYIQFIFSEQNITIPRTVSEIWNFSTPVSSPSVGDLVFFETYRQGPSHLGLYIGNNEFIHAGSSNGVVISNLDDDYWDSRYIGSKRIDQQSNG